jgi:hypothetical protein
MNALRQTFNRDDRLPGRALGGIDARDHRLAVYKHSTGAALRFFATDLCARQAKPLAEEGG